MGSGFFMRKGVGFAPFLLLAALMMQEAAGQGRQPVSKRHLRQAPDMKRGEASIKQLEGDKLGDGGAEGEPLRIGRERWWGRQLVEEGQPASMPQQAGPVGDKLGDGADAARPVISRLGSGGDRTANVANKLGDGAEASPTRIGPTAPPPPSGNGQAVPAPMP